MVEEGREIMAFLINSKAKSFVTKFNICYLSVNWLFITLHLEQYAGKMLEIKEVMDNVLAKQKAERDDLAKKYRWVKKR